MTYKCFIHGFVTEDPEEFDKHCYETGHVNEEGRRLANGKMETVIEPYPRHHLRDMLRGRKVLGPFSKENPPPPEILKELEGTDFDDTVDYHLDVIAPKQEEDKDDLS